MIPPPLYQRGQFLYETIQAVLGDFWWGGFVPVTSEVKKLIVGLGYGTGLPRMEDFRWLFLVNYLREQTWLDLSVGMLEQFPCLAGPPQWCPHCSNLPAGGHCRCWGPSWRGNSGRQWGCRPPSSSLTWSAAHSSPWLSSRSRRRPGGRTGCGGVCCRSVQAGNSSGWSRAGRSPLTSGWGGPPWSEYLQTGIHPASQLENNLSYLSSALHQDWSARRQLKNALL